MGLFFIVLAFFLVFVLLMSVKLFFKKQPISGSCGGLNVAMQDDDGKCLSCGMTVDQDMKNTIQDKMK